MDEKQLLEGVLDVLRSQNIEGDAYLEHRRNLTLQVRDGRLEELNRAEVRGLAVRAMREGRLGFVHTSDLEQSEAEHAALQACELAWAASPREDLVLADPSGPGDGSDEGEPLGLWDPGIETRTIAEKQEWARAAEAAAMQFDPKVRRSEGAGWTENLSGIWLANTRGLFRHYRKSALETSVSVVAENAGDMHPGDASVETIRLGGLPDPADLGRRAGERAVRLLGGRPIETGRYPVVFSPDTGWTLLVYVALALSGDPVSRGRSWLCDRLAGGAEPVIGSDLVTVRDDGRHRQGPATAPFDAEGVDTQTTVLLENGKVRGRLCDLASGRRLQMPSTGNAERSGYQSLPEIQSRNLYLVAGTATPEEILAPIEKGLWVWALSGWWIGLDPSNSRFSSAASGLWIENGKPTRPVARVTVAGGLDEILGGIEQVGNDLTWDHPTKTPTFRVRDLSVSGT